MTRQSMAFGLRMLRVQGPRARRLVALVAAAALVFPVAWALADPASPISVTNVDSPDPVSSGSELTYTITVVNTAGSRMSNVVLSDQVNGVGGIGVPPQLVLTSTRGSCAQNANLVTCSAGTIEGGGSWTVTIRGIVTAPNGTTVNNTASVTGTRSAQNFTSTATTSTLISNGGGSALPELSVSKTGPTSVAVSSPMTYTLTVNNTGNSNAMGVKVVDTVPAGVTGISASGTSLFTCSVSGQTVTCEGGAVNQGSNATITIDATSPAAQTTITNTASVDPDNTIAESNELNNTSSLVNTQVVAAGDVAALTIDKTDAAIGGQDWSTGAGPDPVTPGSLLTYKIFVTNNSSLRADDVVMVDGTQGLEAASIVGTQLITDGTEGNFGGCTVTAPQIRCLARTLNAGGTIVYTITGRVVAAAGSTIINTATVTGNIKNQGKSSTDTEMTTVKPGVDLTITKADSPDPVCARSWPGPVPVGLLQPPVCLGGLTYSFVIGNSGIEAATNVVVRDPLPPGAVYHAFTDVGLAGFTCTADAQQVVTCTGGTIPPESTRALQIVAIAPAAVGPISNTAIVDPANAIFEADETNNQATTPTLVKSGIDLVVLKVDAAPGFDPIATNGTQTYTITVDNVGTQDATGIRVRDTLPANTVFRSATADNGFTCAHAAGIVECVGGSLKGTAAEFYPPFGGPGDDTATIVIRIFAQPNVGNGPSGMHNEVRVDPNGEIAEEVETNNFEFEDTNVGTGGGAMGAFHQLTIAKAQTSPANPVARNGVVTYTITVGNDGTDPVTDVKVRDFLPAGARYIEATGTNEFLCTELSSFVDCVGGEIAAGGSATITLKAFAPDTPGTYTNQAIVDPDAAIPEGNEFDNQASVQTVVQNGGNGAFNDLTIEKTGTANAVPGGTISYTLSVRNLGSDPASQVAVRDVLPAGTTFVSAEDTAPGTPGAFTCAEAGGTVDCTGATLLAGGVPRLISIVVTAPNQIITLTNEASVDPANAIPEGDELNNTDTFDTAVQSVINLKTTLEGPSQASQNEVKEYVIKVKNEKPSGGDGQTAFGVTVHDPLPVGLIPLAVDAGSGNNFACQVAENPINVVDCLGDLNPDQEVAITITVFITAESNRSLDNEACADVEDQIAEYDPPGNSDNCSTHTTPFVPAARNAPDLLVTKTGPGTVTPGSNMTWTIKVENIGGAPAKSPVVLTDDLPDGVTFVNATGVTAGWTCAQASGVVTCQDGGSGLATGASAEVTIEVTIAASAQLPIVNTAVAAPALVDPAPDATLQDETNLDDNDSTFVTSVGTAPFDLAITGVVDNPDPAQRGKEFNYVVNASNGGTDTATGVKVKLELPSTGLTFLGASGTNGFNCGVPAANVLECTGDLPGGGNTTITVKSLVNMSASADLTLVATIDPVVLPDTDGAFTEGNEANNSMSAITSVAGETCLDPACVDLVAALLLDSPDPVADEANVTYTFVIANIGANPVTLGGGDALAWFDLFGDVTEVVPSSSNASVTCVTDGFAAGSSLLSSCSGTLNPGASATLTLTVQAKSPGTITAVGRVDPADNVAETNDHQAGPPATYGNNLLLQLTTVQ